MRVLLLIIILLTGACSEKKTSAQNNEVADKPEIITPEERASIIAGLEKYFIQDKETSFYRITNFIIININNSKMIEISLENAGKTIVWENKYGITSYEYNDLLLKESEINSLPSKKLKAILLSLYHETNIEYLQKKIESIFGPLDLIFYQGGIFSAYFDSPEILYKTFKQADDNPELKNTLLELVLPDNPEERRNYLLNSTLFAISLPNSMDDHWKEVGFYSDDI